MGDLIQLNTPLSRLTSLPENIFKLRWRIENSSGVEITGPWTPNTKYPSLKMILKELEDRIEQVAIDGINMLTKEFHPELIRVPGYSFLDMSYKGMVSVRTGRSATIGIEIFDRENNSFLILRDGTCYQEIRKTNVPNNNDKG